jgi:hypothetical protein
VRQGTARWFARKLALSVAAELAEPKVVQHGVVDRRPLVETGRYQRHVLLLVKLRLSTPRRFAKRTSPSAARSS